MINQTLIQSLIRDSLVNLKLVSGLNALGLNADDYHIYLPDTVFKLMGMQNMEYSDLIFEKIYMSNAQRVKRMQFPPSENELDRLSEAIYEQLLFARETLMD